MSGGIRREVERLGEAARQAGIQPDDPLAPVMQQLGALALMLGEAAERQKEEAERTIFRAGLVVARQLAVRVERRTAMAVGAVGVLIAVVAGYTGYEIGATRLGPIAVCWQQTGKDVCAPAAWLGAMK